MLDYLAVEEIVRPLASGTTEPFQCRLEDDQLYAVKGRGAMARGLLAEAYSAVLGQALALPIPPFVLARLSKGLVASSPAENVGRSLGAGVAFGSLWQQPVEDVSMASLKSFDAEMRAKLYVFDHWIKNGDRALSEHGGNANLLISLTTRTLIVIDHNLAFSTNYSPVELNFHACRSAWANARTDMFFRDVMKKQLEQALTSIVGLETDLPEEWLEVEPTFPQEVLDTLSRVNDEAFWDELQ